MKQAFRLFAYTLRYVAIVVCTLAIFGLAGSISDFLLPLAAIATLLTAFSLTLRPTKLGPIIAIPFFSSAAAQAILAYATFASTYGLPFSPWIGLIAPIALLVGLLVLTAGTLRHPGEPDVT
jgi:hypothetical protein